MLALVVVVGVMVVLWVLLAAAAAAAVAMAAMAVVAAVAVVVVTWPIGVVSVTKPLVVRARYCMIILVASVLPAPDSPEMMMDWFTGLPEPTSEMND